jgi:hypothetical protein
MLFAIGRMRRRDMSSAMSTRKIMNGVMGLYKARWYRFYRELRGRVMSVQSWHTWLSTPCTPEQAS